MKRPDGSSATAVSPAVASAANAHLGGASIQDAYKAAGITLPPPGTQIKDTLPSLSVAQPGDLAVFKDKYVMLLGDGKIYLDGQEQPVSALAKLTGFMAFCHPPASSTPNVPVLAAPAAAAPAMAATTPAGCNGDVHADHRRTGRPGGRVAGRRRDADSLFRTASVHTGALWRPRPAGPDRGENPCP